LHGQNWGLDFGFTLIIRSVLNAMDYEL